MKIKGDKCSSAIPVYYVKSDGQVVKKQKQEKSLKQMKKQRKKSRKSDKVGKKR